MTNIIGIMDQDRAQTIALQALTFLAGDERALAGFLATSGMDRASLAVDAQNPAVLGGVLDFVMQSDDLLLAFCAQADVTPDSARRARQALPGAPPAWSP
jgi:hypothetical protein